jgi:hypothetical protein
LSFQLYHVSGESPLQQPVYLHSIIYWFLHWENWNFEWIGENHSFSNHFWANYISHIKTHSPGWYIILTDSLSPMYALESRIISPKVHELVYQCKEAFWQLNEIGHEITNKHSMDSVTCCIGGNERVDWLTKSAAIGDAFLQRPSRSSNFVPLAKIRMPVEWQEK